MTEVMPLYKASKLEFFQQRGKPVLFKSLKDFETL